MKTPRTPIRKVYKIKRISTNDLKKLQNMFRSITNIVKKIAIADKPLNYDFDDKSTHSFQYHT